ncbi:uncharacterized protein BDR25DRAFT_305890 [Lindgomyces ingoldianus]|uniref:Uncharacterized protein n=1 Tax=Lindgomyces ingoldianus TaxID=673940 RepID=A0ACB6QJP8_9PLEO|nr:uncharacterized protein BDR25DRAFT_305890 [Lindgomyces ingoldianus]KAF2467111.1 hypothetical protein BDR25DRAFT_305890 [Lindgomyces ingoldianus]
MKGDLNFALVLQPLVLPCLSLFNTVPSAHLHLYSRTNNPLLALWFSSIMALLYLASALIDIAACAGSTLRSECPSSANHGTTGPNINQNMWNASVGLWIVSFVGYALLAYMAAAVWWGFRKKEKEGGELELAEDEVGGRSGNPNPTIRTRGIGEGRRVRDWEEEMLTEDQRAERLRKAEEKWRKVLNL